MEGTLEVVLSVGDICDVSSVVVVSSVGAQVGGMVV